MGVQKGKLIVTKSCPISRNSEEKRRKNSFATNGDQDIGIFTYSLANYYKPIILRVQI